MASQQTALKRATEQFSDQLWRLSNLYWIRDEDGNRVKFNLNRAQEHFYWEMHLLNIILKARQLGFTTLIQLYLLDTCLFNSNVKAGTVAHRDRSATEIFKDTVKYAYDNLPDGLKQKLAGEQDSTRALSFSNDSSLIVDTSIRSGTVQYLHVSEFGKLCAQAPDRAREVTTGTLNALHAGNVGFIESTAEGREGKFFEMCQEARKLKLSRAKLTPLDWKFHFYDWSWRPEYVLPPGDVVITSEDTTYFDDAQADAGLISPEQRAWYVKKKVTQGDDMKREFPSTPDEAFEAAIEGAYYAKEMAFLRANGRMTSVPWEPKLGVNTFWDIGQNDRMSIWFHQRHGKENRLIDHYESTGEGFAHYAKVLKDKPYVYDTHYLPHDIEVHNLDADRTLRKDTLLGLGIKPIKTIRRAIDLGDDIEGTRQFLLTCWFDEEKCDSTEKERGGISALENYRKEWDERLGTFRSQPLKNWARDAADAFRTGAVGFKEETGSFEDAKRRHKRKRGWIR